MTVERASLDSHYLQIQWHCLYGNEHFQAKIPGCSDLGLVHEYFLRLYSTYQHDPISSTAKGPVRVSMFPHVARFDLAEYCRQVNR